MIRTTDLENADRVIVDLMAIGLIVDENLEEPSWKEVGKLKARGRIALPDCFCLTLAIKLEGRVVTSDHREFDPLVPLGLCPILFIR